MKRKRDQEMRKKYKLIDSDIQGLKWIESLRDFGDV